MDYEKAVEKVYEHVNRNEIDRAVMECLRIARHRKDYLYSAIFMRELYPNKLEVARALCDDLSHLKKETQELVLKKSYEYWETVHTLDFSITGDDERKVFLLGVGEIEGELVEG